MTAHHYLLRGGYARPVYVHVPFPSRGMKPYIRSAVPTVYASWGQLPAPLIAFYKHIHSYVLIIIWW